MQNSTEEVVKLLTPKVIQALLNEVKPPAIIDCRGVEEYFQGLRALFEKVALEYIGISTTDLQTLDEARIIESRNKPPSKYILIENLQEAKARLTHFHSQDSLGSLRQCNIREFIESFYFGDRSKELYDQTGLAELKDLLVKLAFPVEEIEPLHRLLFEIRKLILELKWFDEVHLGNMTSVEKTWQEIGEILEIDFSDMPNFSVLLREPQLFQKFQEDAALFIGDPNSLIRELQLNRVLQRKHESLKVEEPRTKRGRVLSLTIVNTRSKRRLESQLKFCELFLETRKTQFVGSLEKDLNLICGICLSSFTSDAELREHIESKAIVDEDFHKEYICNRCGYISISSVELIRHRTEAHPPSQVARPRREVTAAPEEPQPPLVEVYNRNTVLIRPEWNAKLLELHFDTFTLPNEFEITQITYDGKQVKFEMRFVNRHLHMSLYKGEGLRGDLLHAVIFDPTHKNFIIKTVPGSQYLGSSLTEELLERRKDVLQNTNSTNVSSYWSVYCQILKALGESEEYELMEKIMWMDVYETRILKLPNKCSLNIDKENNRVIWTFYNFGNMEYRLVRTQEQDDKTSLILDFSDSTFTIDGEKLDVYLMPEIHPTKLYASTIKGRSVLYEIPVTISKEGRYYYNYRWGRPVAIFVKSLVEIDRSDIKDYMNSVNSVEDFVKSRFVKETHTEHIARRSFYLIEDKYISQLKFTPYECLRILDLGAGDGSMVYLLIYNQIFEQLPERFRPIKIELQLNDIAPQNLGIRLIRAYERARGRRLLKMEKVDLRARARDFRDEIKTLSEALGSRYFDITILSRLLNMYTSIEIVTIESPQRPDQLYNTPDSEGRYIQFPFNHFYTSCKQLKDRDIHPWDSVSIGRYWVPRRVSASSIRRRELERVLKIISTISKSVVVVDLCVNQRLIWEALQGIDSEVYFIDRSDTIKEYQPTLSPERCEQFFYTYIIYK